MKHRITAIALLVCFPLVMSAQKEVMQKTGKEYVVNSGTLTDARGFKGKTPVEVHIEKGKITKIVALNNMETPRFFDFVKNTLLPLYEKLTLKEAQELSEKTHIDATTGATLSANAMQRNINAALKYYEKNK